MKTKGKSLDEDSLDILLDISENSIAPALEVIKNDLKEAATQFVANAERIKAGLELFSPIATQLAFLPDINEVVSEIVSESKRLQAETEKKMIEGEESLHESLEAN